MKRIIFYTAIASFVLTACSKSGSNYKPISSLTLVNATTDISNAKAYAASHLIPWATLPTTDAAAQYRFTHLGAYAGTNNVLAVSAADTTVKLFDNTSKGGDAFVAGKFNNLFLCGNTSVGYDAVFLSSDEMPNHSDSVIGIRFINLSPNSTPVNITLSTSTTTNEVAGLAYKQKTDIKTYTSTASMASIIFQVRNASGTLLATYTLPKTPASPYTTVGLSHARFKNLTLVVKGLQGTTSGTNAFGIFPVAHY